MTTFAFIPARKNSRRIPGKNLRKIKGKSLIERTIEIARDSKIFDKLIVSTDCDIIKHHAKSLGAEIFIREEETQDGELFIIELVQNWIKNCTLLPNDVVAVILPTAPMRTSEELLNAYKTLTQTSIGCATFTKVTPRPHLLFTKSEDQFCPLYKKQYISSTKSDAHNDGYYFNESCVIDNVDRWLSRKTLLPIPCSGILSDRTIDIIIDTESDLEAAEYFINRKLS